MYTYMKRLSFRYAYIYASFLSPFFGCESRVVGLYIKSSLFQALADIFLHSFSFGVYFRPATFLAGGVLGREVANKSNIKNKDHENHNHKKRIDIAAFQRELISLTFS